ncbi:hypothetical protein NXT52_005546 [Escherichia coli]|nr:hypothetical protein [Escherichia coli]EJN7557956.1 hypothetical protein [Escherichia coli]EJP4742085.1 hypothetical protein [Escherichia coli]EKD2537426.1 hypothetical protein [Escherichia coli]EKD2542025.1 hypothetical protein [Escherichia coli]
MIEADDGVLNDDLATVVGCESHKLHAVFNSNWCQGSWLGNFENGVNVFDLTNSDVFFWLFNGGGAYARGQKY